MNRTRSLDARWKIQTPSCPEIQRGLRYESDRLADAGVKHFQRKIAPGPLMNAVIAWFLSRSDDDREAIVRDGLTVLDKILSQSYVPPDLVAFRAVPPPKNLTQTMP